MMARLADLFQVSLDQRLLPLIKGYVISCFPLVSRQDWAGFERAMPFLYYFHTLEKARLSACFIEKELQSLLHKKHKEAL